MEGSSDALVPSTMGIEFGAMENHHLNSKNIVACKTEHRRGKGVHRWVMGVVGARMLLTVMKVDAPRTKSTTEIETCLYTT